MSKLIFTAEMFLSPGHDEPVYEIAQAIHDKYMASGTVVTGDNAGNWFESMGDHMTATYIQRKLYIEKQAILHNIKEIEKAEPCDHVPIWNRRVSVNDIQECRNCGEDLRSTGWKLAEGEGE